MKQPLKKYDAIIVGGGHNGLVAAGYLAKAGQPPFPRPPVWPPALSTAFTQKANS